VVPVAVTVSVPETPLHVSTVRLMLVIVTPEAFATIRPGAAAVPPGELGPASATPANNIASAAASRVRLAAEFTYVI
jgi:hypothetical protein